MMHPTTRGRRVKRMAAGTSNDTELEKCRRRVERMAASGAAAPCQWYPFLPIGIGLASPLCRYHASMYETRFRARGGVPGYQQASSSHVAA